MSVHRRTGGSDSGIEEDKSAIARLLDCQQRSKPDEDSLGVGKLRIVDRRIVVDRDSRPIKDRLETIQTG